MTPIAIALGMLIPGVAIILLLRIFHVTRTSRAELAGQADLSWKDYRPFHRLLDPADFDFLRKRGIAESRIRKLRTERRKIYRSCLRSLAQDFNQIHRMLSLVMIHSSVDRSDLAAE